MSENKIKTKFRKNYKAPGFIIESIDLTFELFDKETIVQNVMKIRNLDEGQDLALDGEALELLSITLNDQALNEKQYQINDNGLVIKELPAAFTLAITTKIYPHKNLQLSGLYRSHKLFCTQCEAEGFRRITYFLDRPDVLTTYTTKIIADKAQCPVLLSNGNLIDSGMAEDGRHYAIWHDPFKKPSYLFALVAGELVDISDSFTTASGRQVALKIFVEKGNETQCDHAMDSLKKSMVWDEQVYGREYDLDIFMIVAVSDFNMGAMENKGLNIFNTKYILADKASATDQDFAGVEGVVAHEYFHNWTGNRVTCRDWFQLSLKEGLTVFRDQEFSRDMNSRSVNRIQDVKILRTHQFPEDAGPMAHPVRPESYIEINNFYTTTIYNKGAEVIRMQHTILGANKYRKGMDLYFERHDGQAVTIDDFVAAMEDANNVDLSQFKRWYSQAGTPTVTAKAKVESATCTLWLSQHCKPTPGQEEKLPFYIPIRIAIFDESGKPYHLANDVLILKEEKQTYEFDGIKDGAVISLLRDFSAPINLIFNQTTAELLHLIKHETDGFARYEAMQTFQKQNYHQLLKELEAGEVLSLDERVYEVFNDLLEQKDLDPALKAELLQPLSFEIIISDMKDVDVSKVMQVKDYYMAEVANHCLNTFVEGYQALQQEIGSNDDTALAGKRKLKNVLLSYLSKVSGEVELIQKQFDEACNMTDELAAYSLLAHCQGEVAEKAHQQFYDKWSERELVLDKWFAVQAMADHANVLSEVRRLMSHPDFHLSNPNKVRALVLSFAMYNPKHFHCQAGYQLLAEVIMKLDKLNPQTAARMVGPFTQWRRYCSPLQALMQASLKQILAVEGLSKDTYEIVSKSLDV